MSSRFPPTAPHSAARPRLQTTTQVLRAAPVPLMELGVLCLFGLLLLTA